jgi:predicted DNA-binding transcriptional regulator AlpA
MAGAGDLMSWQKRILVELLTEMAEKAWPDEPEATAPAADAFMTLREVTAALRISRSTLYSKLKDEPFRSMVAPAEGVRRTRFYKSKVMQHINGKEVS